MDAETAEQVIEQLRTLTTQVGALQRDNERLRAAATPGGGGEESEVAPKALLAKWAPDPFNGDPAGWRRWALKFKTFIGALKGGAVGRWLQHVEDNRDTSALNAALEDENAKRASVFLYSALLGSTEDRALTIVERVGVGEGLEAWRMLLERFEKQTRQSKVMKMIALLSFDLRGDDVADALERFERACSLYESEFNDTIKDDVRIGIVCKGLPTGMLREHMLMLSERCADWADFKRELDLVSRARQANKERAAPMDLDVMTKKGNGKGKESKKGTKSDLGGKGQKGSDRETRTCWFCNKPGHLERDCWSKPGKGSPSGGSKGATKGKKGGKNKGKGQKKGEIKSMEETEPEEEVLAGLLMTLGEEEPDWGCDKEPEIEEEEGKKESEKEAEDESSYEYYYSTEEEEEDHDRKKSEGQEKKAAGSEKGLDEKNRVSLQPAKEKEEKKKKVEEAMTKRETLSDKRKGGKSSDKKGAASSARDKEDEEREKGKEKEVCERKCSRCWAHSALQPCEIQNCERLMCAKCGLLVEDQGKVFMVCPKHYMKYYEKGRERAKRSEREEERQQDRE